MTEKALLWQRSFACEDAACVEVCVTPEGVMVRSSTAPDGLVLHFTTAAWKAFLAEATSGQFDPPTC